MARGREGEFNTNTCTGFEGSAERILSCAGNWQEGLERG